MEREYRQGTKLIASKGFWFINPQTSRRIVVKPGQRFWVTNSSFDQGRSGSIKIEREGRGHISHGWPFAESTLDDLFEIAA